MRRPVVLVVTGVATALVAIGAWVFVGNASPVLSVQVVPTPVTTLRANAPTSMNETAPPTTTTPTEETPTTATNGTTPTERVTPATTTNGTVTPTTTTPPTEVELLTPTTTPSAKAGSSYERPGLTVGADPADSGRREVYTWQDGDRTMRVRLQPDLTVRDEGAVAAGDEIVAMTTEGGIVRNDERSDAGAPVFRSESGALMTLPGGVLLVLDAGWSRTETNAFFAWNAIRPGRVSELGYIPNGFFVETEPGFPSLELANTLAGQEGVVVSSPNWWTEIAAS